MSYSIERIYALASMAHIALADGEAEELRQELDGMHALAEHLQNAPLAEAVPDPFLGAVGLDELREDIPGECLPPEELLHSARGNGYFTVPRVVEGES